MLRVRFRVCGVQSFYVPRSNPDGVAVTIYCVEPGTLRSAEVRAYDGRDWEASHARSGIQALSKDSSST